MFHNFPFDPINLGGGTDGNTDALFFSVYLLQEIQQACPLNLNRIPQKNRTTVFPFKSPTETSESDNHSAATNSGLDLVGG